MAKGRKNRADKSLILDEVSDDDHNLDHLKSAIFKVPEDVQSPSKTQSAKEVVDEMNTLELSPPESEDDDLVREGGESPEKIEVLDVSLLTTLGLKLSSKPSNVSLRRLQQRKKTILKTYFIPSQRNSHRPTAQLPTTRRARTL